MRGGSVIPRALWLAAAAMLGAAGLSACAEKPQAPGAPVYAKHTYTVRAQVVALPDPANPAAEFQVHHEPIPHFNAGGGNLGMNAMIMPFPVAEGLSLSALRAGQKITLTFEVDFDEARDSIVTYRATKVEPLPDDTALDFGRAQ